MIQPKRRGFLLGVGALLAAPAIAKADSLMQISSRVLTPKLWGDGIHDDTFALQALLDKQVETGTIVVPSGDYLITKTLEIRDAQRARVVMNSVRMTVGAPVDMILTVSNAAGSEFHNCHFNMTDVRKCGIWLTNPDAPFYVTSPA